MKGNRGISLIEIVVVVGLFTAIGGLSMLVSIDTYRSYLFRGERDKVVEALQKARSRAINNICFGGDCVNGRSHGVHIDIDPDKVIVFQVHPAPPEYDPSDPINDSTPLNEGITVAGLSEIKFSQLSGDASVEGDITISDSAGHVSVISINSEGRILWTN